MLSAPTQVQILIIFVYSGRAGDFVRNMTVSAPAYNIAFDAALNRLFVSTQYGLIAINSSSGATISSVRLGSFSEGMAIDQNSQVVYVANYLSASISAVSATNLTVIKTIQLPNSSYPSDLALDTSTGVLYSTTDQNYVVAINTTDRRRRTDDPDSPSHLQRHIFDCLRPKEQHPVRGDKARVAHIRG